MLELSATEPSHVIRHPRHLLRRSRHTPARRYGQWAAAVVVLVPLGLGTLPAGNMLIGALKGTSIVMIPLLMVATLWCTVVTSVLGLAQYYGEKHYARGTGATR